MKILQVVGYKNAGKTRLVVELVRSLSAKGLRIGTIKHDGHDFEPDVTGTDTWQHRHAGAQVTAISSANRTAWYIESPTAVAEMLASMQDYALDGVIAEGFKTAPYPKIVLLRNAEDADLLALPNIIAAVTRESSDHIQSTAEGYSCPLFMRNHDENDEILKFIADWFEVSE